MGAAIRHARTPRRRAQPVTLGAALAAAGLVALLAVLAAGCGSSRSSGTANTNTSTGAPTTSGTPGPVESTTTPSGSQGSGSGDRGGESSRGASETGSESSGYTGDNSIQTYGSEATDAQRAAVVGAMRSFFRALAESDYATVCNHITTSNREQLRMYLKAKHEEGRSCASLLATSLPSQARSARKALGASVIHVRTKEGNAFVVFKPAGGRLSFFVMEREGGAWKSNRLTPGTPFP